MNIDISLLTYKRPSITSLCLKTLLYNTEVKPRALNIFDDCSDRNMKTNLIGLLDNTNFNVNLLLRNKNYGVGVAFEDVYKSIDTHEPDIAVISESDYVWRQGWLEDIISIYNSNPYVVGIPGTSHPDMYDMSKVKGEYIKFMVDQWGTDIQNRDNMYIPFNIPTKDGNIQVQGVANSCGCVILFWNRLKTFLKDINCIDLYWEWMYKGFHKHNNRKLASDAIMSGTVTYLWERWAIKNGIDTKNNFAWLDICDYTIAQHVCGGQDSINGKIVAEGCTFILSPRWKNEYLETNPRIVPKR